MNRLRYVLLAAISVVCTSVMGQEKSITERTYWLDGDYATAASLGASVDISSLAVGLHSLTARVKDSEGLWSSPVTKFFVIPAMPDVASEVAEREYWLDGDFAGRSTLGASEAFIDLGEQLPGMHSFSMRVRDDVNVWSAPVTKFFIIQAMPDVASEVAEREYWLDGDFAGRTPLGTSEAIIDLGELGAGMHSFTMRLKNDVGVWSAPVTKYFVIAPIDENQAVTLTQYAYWFDDDITRVKSGPLEAASGIIPVSIKHLDEGRHALSWTVGDSRGHWSAAAVDSFEVVHLPLTEMKFDLAERTFEYSGEDIEPEPTIIDGDETLVRDEDYEVLYADNHNAGTASMNVRGIGFYKDSIQTDFTITKAPLTVKADDKVKEQGEENPELTFIIEGWKGNDDESVLDALPVATTAATAESPAGMYDILINGGEALNYTFIYVSGVLTIEEQVGIDNVSDGLTDDEWYTLAGQKLDRKPTKAGIYIHNGRKVLVK